MQEPTRFETFPELVKWQKSCRLCQLAESNPNVVTVVHTLYQRGFKNAALLEKLSPVFAEAEEKMPSRQAFNRHLETHCAILQGAPMLQAEGREVDQETDYFELRGLYHDFKTIFAQIKKDYHEARGQKKKTISDYGLVMLVKLASELRAMLKTLSDMRNSEKLMTIVLARHTEQLMHLLTEPLGVSIRGIRDSLRRGEDPREVADRIDAMIDGELFPLFENAAHRALEQSKAQYNLH